jgi:hypothetical protein
MTEEEWFACADPDLLLRSLPGPASPRKLRLYGCACVREVWQFLLYEGSRSAIEIVERYVDGEATADELDRARSLAERAAAQSLPHGQYSGTAYAASAQAAQSVAVLAWNVTDVALTIRRGLASNVLPEITDRKHCHILRDVFGNPFNPVMIDPAWLTWNDHTVPKIAMAIHYDRAFDRLPILADALEDAGCDNADLLSHCRSGGEHVRGCWAVDLLLGKS